MECKNGIKDCILNNCEDCMNGKTVKAYGIWKSEMDRAVDTDTELPFAIFFNPQDAYDLKLYGLKAIELTLNLDP